MQLLSLKKDNGFENIITIYEPHEYNFKKLSYGYTTVRGKKRTYVNLIATFDIESSTIICDKPYAFMYIWQMCINGDIIIGRTWDAFLFTLDKIKKVLELDKGKRLVFYVHNLSYEFQFMKDFLKIERVFATEKRKVVTCDANNAFEFRCSYKLSNMSLAKFCENSELCEYKKCVGDLDYHIVRYPNTELTQKELSYCVVDVLGLYQCIKTLLTEDNLGSIPLTSTGYVRRECRKNVNENPKNRELFLNSKLDLSTYQICRLARRGGNTHANALHSNDVVQNMKSKDIISSYPYVMLNCYFPITKFREIKPTFENINKYKNNKCLLFIVTLSEIFLKNLYTVPYLSKAKTLKCINGRYDNGRVLSSDSVTLALTEIDYNIINKQYSFNIEQSIVHCLYISDRGLLNKEFRQTVYEYFKRKTELKEKDKYQYAKMKNKLNALFGMMLTDIIQEEVVYNGEWTKAQIDVEKLLDNYYKNHKSFLSYQHGLWVTAHARARLQEAIDELGQDLIYCDTDSVKYIGEHEEFFIKKNIETVKSYNDDVPSSYTYNEKTYTLGTWDDDGEYAEFKTIGAKKYCYVDKKDNSFHITVAGLNKKSGAKYIKNCSNFIIGKTIPKTQSGRTCAYYNDDIVHNIKANGIEFLTASNIAIVDVEYTLGVTEEYYDYVESLK